MMQFARWQWAVLVAPIVSVVVFLLVAAGVQIHAWHLSWIWAVLGVVLVAWRWLLVKWTQPVLTEVDELVAEIAAGLPDQPVATKSGGDRATQAEAALLEILQVSRDDPPVWADWNAFWQRCLSLISAIAQVYKPEAKQPLLNIYVPQAYNLLRGTVDDMDAWMQRIAPVMNQVTIEQALQAYEVYQKLQPTARKMWQAWQWARWLLNPAAAATNVATKGTRTKATQELLGNFNQLAKETVLRNLAQQAILLYSGQLKNTVPGELPHKVASDSGLKSAAAPVSPQAPSLQAQSLQSLLLQATPPETIAAPPVNLLLVGRTGAGKSSLINSLFVQPVAAVDALPSTDRIQDYQWQAPTGESLLLWDTPGYEQVGQAALRAQVLEKAASADMLMLLTPALDPALQMDVDFLQALQSQVPDLPTIAVMTQVDRLRPLREWSPPYDWQQGDRAKEKNIRAALEYRRKTLPMIDLILPVVSQVPNQAAVMEPWGLDDLAAAMLDQLEPAKQLRVARFLQSLEARTMAAVNLIDRYTRQMTTQQGITAFLKSPVLQFISSLSTGSPALAIVLAEQIPIEQIPLVVGKAQLAYELYNLVQPPTNFELPVIWPLLIDQRDRPDRNAAAFGYALIEYWAKSLDADQLSANFRQRLDAERNGV